MRWFVEFYDTKYFQHFFFLLDLKISSLKYASDQGQEQSHQKFYRSKNAGDLVGG